MTRRDGKAGGKIRCAIYTRKSTEEGLDQEFNSLDAQREACAAYILSQRHEGWMLVPEHYDDGGFTGGNMERPGLRQILADVKAGRVDVIVVYKVDRLTRALSDFAKIVDVLDAAGASFVSITQAFNTTTSMGRLTLNVLLSFAQFEREVISERVRDKIAASKRKGMWMGGNIPLGYDVRDRKLIVNEGEAATVRHIFQRYSELGNVRQLIADLRHDGIRTKLHHAENGATRGRRSFTAGPLYHILSNRIYRGEVVHKGEVHAGEHEAIISDDLWDKVQRGLADNRVIRKHQSNAKDPSLLAGMIHDGEGRRMTPSHAGKNGIRYRYYVSVDGDTTGARPIRIAAADIERAVKHALTRLLDDRSALLSMFNHVLSDAGATEDLFRDAARFSAAMDTMSGSDQRDLMQQLALNIVVRADRIEASIDTTALATRLGLDVGSASGLERCPLDVPTIMVGRGSAVRLIIAKEKEADAGRRDPKLVEMIVRAHDARRKLGLDVRSESQVSDLDSNERNRLARLARLSFLAPDIVTAIMEGRQPIQVGARRLLRAAEIPFDWPGQRALLGFG